MKTDNKGYSLVELIVVMAILAVVTVASVIGVGMISGKPAEACATNLKTALTSVRTSTMGKSNATLSVYRDASTGEIWIREDLSGNVTTKKIGESSVSVSYIYEGEVTPIDLGDYDHRITIGFDRSSGGLKPDGGKYVKVFEMTKAGKTYKVTIHKLTGKISLE